MVEICRAQGLEAVEGDALGYLRSLPDESLGGLFAAQVAEHLEPDYLLALLEEAFAKLRPGSAIVLETINVGELVRVLLQLHPRHHARAAAASRHAQLPADRARLPGSHGPLLGALSASATSW